MEKESLAPTPHTHNNRKVSFPYQHEHGLHAGLYHHGARRPSVAYRAVKAVENVARRMSTQDFSIDRIEHNLEKELQRELKEPEKLGDILRRSGEKLLHSKKVLFLIVLLNIVDCGLVLGELILDIHFIKDMVFDSKHLIKKFIHVLRTFFPPIFGIIDTLNVPLYFNTVIDTIAQTSSRTNFSLFRNDSGESYWFTHKDMPTFLDPTVTTIEEDIAHAFHKASIAILGFLVLLSILKVFCYGKEIFKKKLQDVLNRVKKLCEEEGIAEWKLSAAINEIPFPTKRKSKKFGLAIKKKLDRSINCIRMHDPRVSLPYGDPNLTMTNDKKDSDSDEEEIKPRMFQVPSIHIIEPSDTIFESDEDELENEEDEKSEEESEHSDNK